MTHRLLTTIAQDINRSWTKPYFGAVPYMQAMGELYTIDQNYGYDSAYSIVRYFLSNAATWKGEDARRIKAELKAMLPEYQRPARKVTVKDIFERPGSWMK